MVRDSVFAPVAIIETVADAAPLAPRRVDSWPAPLAFLAALLVGAALGYISLATGPLGLAAVVVAVALVGTSHRRAALLAPILIGAGIAGALVMLPALTNTDPAVSYPVETGLVPFIVYALVAATGLVLAAVSVVRSRRRLHIQ